MGAGRRAKRATSGAGPPAVAAPAPRSGTAPFEGGPPDAVAILDALGAAVVVTDPDGVVRTWNRAAAALLGWRAGEACGRRADELCGSNRRDARRVPGGLGGLRGGAPWSGELALTRRDGRAVRVQVTRTPLVGPDGAHAGVVAVLADLAGRDPPGPAHPDRLRREQDARRAEALLEDGPDLVVCHDADGVLTYASPSSRSLLGRQPEALVGLAFDALFLPADPPAGASGGNLVAATVRRVLDADGCPHDVELTTSDHLDDPALGAVVVHARDVSGERRAGARFREIVEAAREGIATHDLEGRITFANARFAELLGFRRDDLLGRSVIDLAPASETEHVRRSIRDLVTTPTLRDEFRHLRPDGTEVWIQLNAGVLRDGGAVPVGGLAVVSDVTDRHRAHEELAAREAWLAALLQNAFDLVFTVAPDGQILFATPGAEVVLGYPETAVIGRSGFEFIHPDDLGAAAETLLRVVATPGASDTLELRALHADGTYRWLEMSGTNLLDEPAVRAVVLHAQDITGRKLAEAKLSHLALHDALTDLPNRVLLHDRLTQALARTRRSRRQVGLLLADLDAFKLVNDTKGHTAGDLLLKQVAARLGGAVRPGDTVARLGGDEFVVLLEPLADADEAVTVAARVLRVFDEPFALADSELFVSASIGVALAGAGDSADQLLSDADAAMYGAKAKGRARAELFERATRVGSSAHLAARTALGHALQHDGLIVLYQPVVALPSGTITGAEALVRIADRRGRLMNPIAFVPLAEATGMIGALDAAVLRIACRELAHLGASAPGFLSVNVSAHRLRGELLDELARILEESGTDPGTIVLEITERSLVQDDADLTSLLVKLRELGVHLAIDDFGTGYSSLSYLKRLPVDTIKIDQSFVEGLGRGGADRAIVEAIVAMARALSLQVIAEGIETPAQLESLVELGCELGQGYLFSTPVRAAELEALLATGKPLEARRRPARVR